MSVDARALEALQTYFGFSEFREGQAEVIEAVLKGENSVVVMPTGGGKSAIYELAGLLRAGMSVEPSVNTKAAVVQAKSATPAERSAARSSTPAG